MRKQVNQVFPSRLQGRIRNQNKNWRCIIFRLVDT